MTGLRQSSQILILASLTIWVLTLLCGKLGLPYIRKLGLGQSVRSDGPKSHFKKSGTPTFGGLFFLLPMAASAVILPLVDRSLVTYSILIGLSLAFGLVGFIDDYIKVRVDKEGLSVTQKTLSLGLVCLIFALWFLWFSDFKPILYIPFIKQAVVISGLWKYPYLFFIILYLFFMANAVNITDGIDGLVSSLIPVTSIFLAGVIYLIYPLKEEASPLIQACLALVAGCLGFLPFNKQPAKIFMGDTGSQALGAAFGAIALVAGIPWIMVIIGLIYVVEACSTLIQVFYFKLTGGKRFFKMAPLHHHFELSGWTEGKIVKNYVLFAICCGLLAIGLVLL